VREKRVGRKKEEQGEKKKSRARERRVG